MNYRRLLIPLFFVVFTIFNVTLPVYGANGTIDFSEFPEAFSNATNIPLFAGEIFVSGVFILMFLLPLNATKKGSGLLPNVILGFVLMGFCVAVGWLPTWILIIIGLIIAGIWSSKITDFMGSRKSGG